MSQPTLEQWLNRKPSGPRPKKPLPRATKKRAKQLRQYAKRRELFLADRPICEAWLDANQVTRVSRDDYSINVRGKSVRNVTIAFLVMHCAAPYSTEIHHKEGRIGEKLLDESTWMALSQDWHAWIHKHPSQARSKGWLK